ncbi:MAG: DegT/DnrJ/EryC1/StrS family aminotransferase [Gammaproteobacteria bacterium]|nr:DegT/DnrJ/EryC1/StrS family aminotransferase [Gammaproteobacteria bacterium]
MSDLENGVPFLDLAQEFSSLQDEWISSIRAAGASGQFILGPNVTAFEAEFAAYVGSVHAVSVANGTEALALTLRASGIGAGDEVVTTPYTFIATAEVISQVGATPVFVDIEPGSFNLDAQKIEERITEKTRGIIPVHLFGYPAAMEEINSISKDRGLTIIEDCAQACGAQRAGSRVGSLGYAGCFSFYPTKVLGCYGDGGIVTTDDAGLVNGILKLRNHGASGSFIHDTIGYNSRLDEIQAALLRIKLRKIENDIEARARVAALYNERLTKLDIVVPSIPNSGRHVFNLYTIRVPRRDAVQDRLQQQNIGCSVCYPLPLHLQSVYADLGYSAGDLPVAEQAARECLSLPIFPDMQPDQVARVCDVIEQALCES